MTYIKASATILLLIFTWGALILNEWLEMLVAILFDVSDKEKRKTRDPSTGWLHSKLLAQDIMINVKLGGYFRTTISSELGNLKLRKSKTGTVVANVVDWFFLKLFKQDNHCIGAIEGNDRHIFNPSRMVIGFLVFMLVTILKAVALYVVFSEILWILLL